jgi:hypothetical protein
MESYSDVELFSEQNSVPTPQIELRCWLFQVFAVSSKLA